MAIKADSAFALQRSFRNHLIATKHNTTEANIISNDAFLLFNQMLDIEFDVFLSVGLTKEVQECILRYFMLSGDKENANKKAERYFTAMKLLYSFYTTIYEHALEKEDAPTIETPLVNYCKSMRIQYSYKPILILAMLNTASVGGKASLSEIVHYFIAFYLDRIKCGLVAEKEDSIFSKGEVSFAEAKQNIVNNAVRVLAKDGIIDHNNESIRFTSSVLPDYIHNKTKLVCICNKLIEDYYEKISNVSSNVQAESEEKLGQVLNKMYINASNNEKVIMIHLFGIKYGPIIEKENLNVRSIIKYANMPVSYYVEVRKGIRLSKYVTPNE